MLEISLRRQFAERDRGATRGIAHHVRSEEPDPIGLPGGSDAEGRARSASSTITAGERRVEAGIGAQATGRAEHLGLGTVRLAQFYVHRLVKHQTILINYYRN